ncbi:NPP1 family protein [Streptomyces sp. NPDC057686]
MNGHRHDFEHVVVWIKDNEALNAAKPPIPFDPCA